MKRKTSLEKPPPARSGLQAGSSLRARALRLLARREHTRLELERKLAPYVAEGEDLAALLDDFSRSGWISEQRLVEQVAHARRGRFGSRRIRQELLDKGVDEAAVAQAMPALAAGDLESARAVWARKFGKAAGDRRERARQVRFLQGRGFALDTIMKAIGPDGDENENA